MKYLFIFLSFILLVGCQQKEIEIIHKNDGYTSKKIGIIQNPEISRYKGYMCGNEIYCLYNNQLKGVHYEFDFKKETMNQVESTSFKDTYRGEGYNVKYETKEFLIYLDTEEIRNEDNDIEELIAYYYYVDENVNRLLYQFSIIDLHEFIPRVEMYYDEELRKDIFAYNDENGYILNEIIDGELKEVKRISKNKEYEVCEFYHDEGQGIYEVCANDGYKSILINEEEYKVGINDFVWFSDEYVYQTIMDDDAIEMIETQVIDRSTKEVMKLSEVCHHTMANLNFGENRYLRMNEEYYSVFTLENDSAIDIELPFVIDIYNNYHFIDGNRILFSVYDNEEISFYLVTIEN